MLEEIPDSAKPLSVRSHHVHTFVDLAEVDHGPNTSGTFVTACPTLNQASALKFTAHVTTRPISAALFRRDLIEP